MTVLWRNSPAMTAMPISRTTTPPDDPAENTLRMPSLLSSPALGGLAKMAWAMLTGTKAMVAAMVHQNMRKVRSFSSSARIRSVIGLLLLCW